MAKGRNTNVKGLKLKAFKLSKSNNTNDKGLKCKSFPRNDLQKAMSAFTVVLWKKLNAQRY